jgi:ATP-dependent Clp protease adaptor protein ClpS
VPGAALVHEDFRRLASPEQRPRAAGVIQVNVRQHYVPDIPEAYALLRQLCFERPERARRARVYQGHPGARVEDGRRDHAGPADEAQVDEVDAGSEAGHALPSRPDKIVVGMADTDRRTDGQILERTKQETKKPEMFKVILLNDDYTTMDFVIEILEGIFHKQPAEAYRIMMAVHTQGKGLCGIYPHEVAETKVATVVERARERGFPLLADMEPE